ncbi:MAG: hypothetical protein WD009_02060 [Phycisphaeraceae bacterium]
MLDRAMMESRALEVFEHEWARVAGADAPGAVAVLSPPPGHLLPELVRLLAESDDRPVRELEVTVRHLVIEQGFIDESGDPVVDAEHGDRRECYVRALLRTLARLRQWAMEHGEWSGLPATPQMYG